MRRLLFALILIFLTPLAAAATPYDTFGVGARAIAMGGAYAAVGGDSAALYYNAAALTRAGPFQIEFDYHRVEMDMRLNGRKTDIDPDKGLRVGLIVGKTFFHRRFRVGVTIFTPDDHFMRLVLPPRTAPTFIRYNNINHMQAIITGGAFQVFSWWSLGFGATFVSDHVGGVDFAIREDEPARGNLKSKLGSDTAPVLGTLFVPSHWLTLGFSFREKSQQKMSLPNKISMAELKILQDSGIIIFHDGRLVLEVTSNTHFSPRQYQAGVAVTPWESLLLSADLVYYEYSGMKSNAAYSDVTMEGDFGEVFPSALSLKIPEPDLNDVFGYAFGVEVTPIRRDGFRLDLRGGYNYRPTPAPEQKGISNLIDSNTHIFSAGLGVTLKAFPSVLRAPLSLDVFNQYHYLEPRVMHKSNPTNDIGDYKVTGHANSLGASLTVRF